MSSTITLQTLKHPKILIYLFLTEMWERFSYYGMAAILLLYLKAPVAEGGLGWDLLKATQVNGLYKALVYLTPIIGGLLADKVLGRFWAILIGAALMAFGHLSLAFSGLFYFYAGLGLLVMGNGLFKPNISTLIGEIYSPANHLKELRESAYTIFYIGVNLGAFFGIGTCGWLAENKGWHYGFSVAGIGMCIGIVTFLLSQTELKKYVHSVKKEDVDEPKAQLSAIDLNKIKYIVTMAMFTVIFWMAWEQGSSSLVIFAEQHADLTVFNWEMPVSWVQNFNSLFIVILGLPLAAYWGYLETKNKNPDIIMKFVYALGILAIAFIGMIYCGILAQNNTLLPLWMFFVFYLVQTVAELFLSPLGLSMVAKHSPTGYGSTLMGVWLGATALANYLGSAVSGYIDFIRDNYGYKVYFGGFAVLLFLAGFALFSLRKTLNNMLKD